MYSGRIIPSGVFLLLVVVALPHGSVAAQENEKDPGKPLWIPAAFRFPALWSEPSEKPSHSKSPVYRGGMRLEQAQPEDNILCRHLFLDEPWCNANLSDPGVPPPLTRLQEILHTESWLWSLGEMRFKERPFPIDVGPATESSLTALVGQLLIFSGSSMRASQWEGDPFFTNFNRQVDIQFSRVVYQRTEFNYTKGFILKSFMNGAFDLGLYKQRYFNNPLTGRSTEFSQELEDLFLSGNSGIFRSRALFGKGRQYLLMLRFHLDRP